MDLYEFKANLVYRMSSRTSKATPRNSISKKKQKNKKASNNNKKENINYSAVVSINTEQATNILKLAPEIRI